MMATNYTAGVTAVRGAPAQKIRLEVFRYISMKFTVGVTSFV